MKKSIIDSINEDIKNFRAMEDQAVNEILKKYQGTDIKPPFSDRKSYLEYLETFRNEVSENSKTGGSAYDLIKFKQTIIDSKKITKEIYNLVSQVVPQETSLKKKKKNKSSDLVKVEEEVNAVRSLDAATKNKIKKEINDVVSKYNLEIKKFAEDLSKYLSKAIITIQQIYDPHTKKISNVWKWHNCREGSKKQRLIKYMIF